MDYAPEIAVVRNHSPNPAAWCPHQLLTQSNEFQIIICKCHQPLFAVYVFLVVIHHRINVRTEVSAGNRIRRIANNHGEELVAFDSVDSLRLMSKCRNPFLELPLLLCCHWPVRVHW